MLSLLQTSPTRSGFVHSIMQAAWGSVLSKYKEHRKHNCMHTRVKELQGTIREKTVSATHYVKLLVCPAANSSG